METGTAYAYSIDKLQDRVSSSSIRVKRFMLVRVVGEHVHDNDLVINVTKAKHFTNVRASGSDDKGA